jgi:hypothetical protein
VLRRSVSFGAMGSLPLADSLDFSVGLHFQDWIFRKFNRPINPLPGTFDRHEFMLVVSFGRCSSRLCEDSVGFMLQSCIGGFAKLFRTLQLSDRVFRFSLSCKDVGFAVYRRHSFSCSSFKASFHLWNSGGPNWIKEWHLFSDEELNSWTLVSRGRSAKASFADIARPSVLSGANLVPLGGQAKTGRAKPRSSVFNRISYLVRRHSVRPAAHSHSLDQIDRRAYFQNRSNPSSGNPARPLPRLSLRSYHARHWASRKSVWRPKRILNRHQEISDDKPASNINEISVAVSDDSRYHRNSSLSGNNSFVFELPGQICKRDFRTFPSKYVGLVWDFPPQMWFTSARPSSTGGPSHPPYFNNFGEFAQAVLPRGGSSPSIELALCTKPSSASLPPSILPSPCSRLCGAGVPGLKDPSSVLSEGMAFHRVDPGPFLPHGFTAQPIDHREIMVRTVTRPQPSAHDDWGIVLVQPLPDHEVNFNFFDGIAREYLLEIRNVQIRSVQRSHLGQALVRFRFVFDRDNLVAMGPQQALGFTFTVIRHNAAWNHRALFFNHECWLMLLGFPLDFLSHEHIQNAIGSFGRVLMWDPDISNATRLLVRARVTSLQEVPQFIVFSVAEGFNGVS